LTEEKREEIIKLGDTCLKKLKAIRQKIEKYRGG